MEIKGGTQDIFVNFAWYVSVVHIFPAYHAEKRCWKYLQICSLIFNKILHLLNTLFRIFWIGRKVRGNSGYVLVRAYRARCVNESISRFHMNHDDRSKLCVIPIRKSGRLLHKKLQRTRQLRERETVGWTRDSVIWSVTKERATRRRQCPVRLFLHTVSADRAARSARQGARAQRRLKFVARRGVARILLGGCVPSSPGFRSTSVRSLGSFVRSRPLPRRSRTSRCKVGVSCREGSVAGHLDALSNRLDSRRFRPILAGPPCFVLCSSWRLWSSAGCIREIATLFPDWVFSKSCLNETSFGFRW